MPELILKALECNRPHGGSFDTNVRLSVSVDDGQEKSDIELGKVSFRERRILHRSIQFSRNVQLRLKFRINKQIGDTLTLATKKLPHETNGMPGFHRGKKEFKGSNEEVGAHYYLWYEIVPDGMTAAEFHGSALVSRISLRDTLGRTGRGAMTPQEHAEVLSVPFDQALTRATYRCSEVISVRDIVSLHRPQDGEKGNTVLLRKWIAQHCNIWGEESVISIDQLPEGVTPLSNLLSVPNWRPVKGERSCVLAGFVVARGFAEEDNPTTHMTRDWVFNIIPSPAFSYMLAYTAKTKGVTNPKNSNAESSVVPLSHNEWESGSIPVEWRPFKGEYITIWGRHVFDLGHMAMTTEIHPPHTIVREFTLDGGKLNRAIIGMGFSGGFPGSIEAELQGELNERWNAEFGGFLEHLSLRNRRCWPTNLKKHPLKIKLFPPVPRQNRTAALQAFAVEWKIITIGKSEINEFLKSCGAGGIEGEKKEHTFDGWFPENLQDKPAGLKPVLTERDGYVDLGIDLNGAEDIPVAYFAVVDCGWSDA